MMMHPELMLELAHDRHRELMAEAAAGRLAAASRPAARVRRFRAFRNRAGRVVRAQPGCA